MLNMDEDDFRELGITKRLHQRKIDIALKKYKLRYERREAGGDDDIDIQAEEVDGDMDESDKSSSEESYSDSDDEEDSGDDGEGGLGQAEGADGEKPPECKQQ